MEEDYVTIRNILGEMVGKKLIEITQHDEETFKKTGRAFIDLMFDSGDFIRFYAPSGICCCINPTEEAEEKFFSEER